ncbi:InlB B-repeat-containing protein [Amycolatopsis sp. SID8362]|uniref:InlB B-repeat-containing protein n=1 Tax=Amycolatopsis sp. SID8362 TaxID=2690346 RepID=UPI00136AC5BF|nr:InlB B-repeat-containing protein [Amycolatopsis sp. SID8362]NBH02344.1 hypothetical protein [Amycolatopsis sp. SID8362]NED39047.1 InlB B-repeat-containing protein [Amycolatopsis sp. SID8362]
MKTGRTVDGRRSLSHEYGGAPGQTWRAGITRGTAAAAAALVLGAASLVAAPPLAAATCVSDISSLRDAVHNVPSGGDTVTLCADIANNDWDDKGAGLNISNADGANGADGPVTLELNGHSLFLRGNGEGAGIRTPEATLIINGPGNLWALGGDGSGAGIGGNGHREAGGTVTINSGAVWAIGGNGRDGGGSGIGGGGGDGFDGDKQLTPGAVGTVTINGGTVNATGGSYTGPNAGTGTQVGGAGIGGGGFSESDPTKTIVGGAGGTVAIGAGAVVNATSGYHANAVVGSNGAVDYGTVSNGGTLTLTGIQTNYGTLTNTGLININTRMTGTAHVTNDGTIRLTGGTVDYSKAYIEHHAFLVGYSPSQPNSLSQVLAASYVDAQVPLPAPPSGQAWYSTNTCAGQVVTDRTDLQAPAVFGPKTVEPANADHNGDGTADTNNVTLYAKTQYTVTFAPTGGTPTPATQPVASGCYATKPTEQLSKTNYTFKGWFTEPTGGTEWRDFTATPVTSDLFLYAQWESTATTSTTSSSSPPSTSSTSSTVPVGPTPPTTPGSTGTIVVSDATGVATDSGGSGTGAAGQAANRQAGLAQTGVEVRTLLYWALPMLLVGTLALIIVRRRRRGTR